MLLYFVDSGRPEAERKNAGFGSIAASVGCNPPFLLPAHCLNYGLRRS